MRVRGIDPQTRPLGIDVSVPDPYGGRRARPRSRRSSAACTWRSRWPAGAQPDQVVIPRSALHDDVVYLVEEESRLERRPVTIALRPSRDSRSSRRVSKGGETLVVSDLAPAARGHAAPIPSDDADALTRLRADAAGETTVR